MPVGRLDMASTGVLVFTNDTRLAHWLTDPDTKMVRTYLVTVRGRVEDETVQRIEQGMTVDGDRLQAEACDRAQAVESRDPSGRGSRRRPELAGDSPASAHGLQDTKSLASQRACPMAGLELGQLRARSKWRTIAEPKRSRASGPRRPRHALRSASRGVPRGGQHLALRSSSEPPASA